MKKLRLREDDNMHQQHATSMMQSGHLHQDQWLQNPSSSFQSLTLTASSALGILILSFLALLPYFSNAVRTLPIFFSTYCVMHTNTISNYQHLLLFLRASAGCPCSWQTGHAVSKPLRHSLGQPSAHDQWGMVISTPVPLPLRWDNSEEHFLFYTVSQSHPARLSPCCSQW